MTNSGHEKVCFRLATVAIALLLGASGNACTTPATADPPASATGGSPGDGRSGGAIASPGTGGASLDGSGGAPGTPGSGGAAPGSSGGTSGTVDPGGTGGAGATGSVGSSGGSSAGTGGKSVTSSGGTNGSGGATGAGGTTAGAGSGCNWVHNADGTWAFGTPAPADKIVIFDGTTKNGWHKLNMPGVAIDWNLLPDGTLKVVPSGTGQATLIQSDMKFEDLCLHVEYMTPPFPSTTTDVQKQGNSGVYLKSAYEMQILDTSKLGPLVDGCGAVYQLQAPLVVACNMYSVWNTYEIEFKSSVWSGTTKTKNASFVKVTLNGKLVQMNVDLTVNVTKAGIPGGDVPGPQPMGLQDHLDLVSFRNIWATVPKY